MAEPLYNLQMPNRAAGKTPKAYLGQIRNKTA